MKKLFAAILSLVLVLSLSTAFAGEKLSVIATENPHAEILELVKDDLAALGYDLDLTIATDYVIENPATAAGDVMANFFQHLPYLAQYNGSVSEAEQLVPVIYTHFEPMAIYAGTKSSLDDIADGDKIAIPNDPVNENRALLLLQDAGLIKLPEGTTLESTCTPLDVVENTKNLELVELNAELITGARSDVAYAVINGNYATLENLVPNADGLYVEGADSLAAQSYVNVVAVKPENAEADWVKALQSCLCSEKTYEFMTENEAYAGGVIPFFSLDSADEE